MIRSIFAMILVPFTILLVSGCLTERSSKIEQSKITTDYTLHYDDSDKSLIGEVQFTTQKKSPDGSYSETVYIELNNDSYVYFDDQIMVESRNFFDQITYKKVRTGDHWDRIIGLHTFRYLQNTGETWTNKTSPLPIPKAKFQGSTVSKSGFNVSWSLTEPIGNDSLELSWYVYNQYPGQFIVEEKGILPHLTEGDILVSSEKLLSWEAKRTYFTQICRVRNSIAQEVPAKATGMLRLISCSARQPLSLEY